MAESHWSSAQARAYLAAMKAVALGNRRSELVPLERQMLDATARHVLHHDVDVDALEPITPVTLANTIREPRRRAQAVQFLVLMPYLGMALDPHAVERVDRFAAALGVAPATLEALHQVRDGRLRKLQIDYLRRSFASGLIPGATFLEKLRAVIEAFHQYAGDPTVASRYYAYARYPRGSLGRVFHDFYQARGFPLPGEKGSFSELLVPHDLTHILGGFNTDMSGEIDVAGMEAGMARTPFGYELLLDVILDFHMGLAFTTAGLLVPGTGHFHPDSMLTGFERGARMHRDLLIGWDWHAVMHESVPALRERYGITGATIVDIPPPAMDDANTRQA
jgi:hypothetical protein